MKRISTIILVLQIFTVYANAQITRTPRKEENGFEWAKVNDRRYESAETNSGQTIISGEYNSIRWSKGYFYATKKIGKKYVKALYDETGKLLIPAERQYTDITVLDDYIQTKSQSKIGACDLNGNEIIPPLYIDRYSSDLVFNNGSFKYKDKTGNWVPVPDKFLTSGQAKSKTATHPEKDIVNKIKEHDYQYTQITTANNIKEILDKNNKVIIPRDSLFEQILYATNFFIAKKGNTRAAFDKNGKQIIGFGRYIHISPFNRYLREYKSQPSGYSDFFTVAKYYDDKLQYGLCDSEGREILPCVLPYYKFDFEDIENQRFIIVKNDNYPALKKAVFTFEGEEIIAPDTYDDFYITGSHAVTIKNNKRGIYDLTLRQELLKPLYEDANYHKGFPGIAVKRGEMWRLIELDGESEIISYNKYDEFRLCYDNYHNLPYACVKKNGSWGVINKYGYEVVPCTYPNTLQFRKNNTAMGFVCGDRACIVTEEELALNPEAITEEVANSYILSTASGKQLKNPNGSSLCHGLTFDLIYWNSFSKEFTVTWNGWRSDVKPNGFELKNIPSQIFDKAYSLDETQYEEKFDLYNQIIDFDPDNAYGWTASALCNIGFIYESLDDYETALQYYDKSASINNPSSVGATNAKNIRNYYKAQDRQSKLEMVGNILSATAQALETASRLKNNQGSVTQYSEGAYNKSERASRLKARKTNHAGATAQNSRGSVNAYNGYVEQLINMNTYHETQYNDSQRRNIQSKMKQIRESNNSNSGHIQISKSQWETWDGKKR